MFDAKSLLEELMRGAGQPQHAAAQQAQAGGLGDILGQLGKALGQGGGQGAGGGQQGGGGSGGGLGGLGDILKNMTQGGGQGGGLGGGQSSPQQGGGGLGGLGDILKNMTQGGGSGGGQGAGQAPATRPSSAPASTPAGDGGLGDILGKLQEQLGKGGHGGGLMDILGQVLGQATAGVKEGAQRADQATGASGHVRDAIGKATGQSPDDLMAQLKDLIAKNQLGAGAAAGGLGAVVLGTKAGRSLASQAIKLGGLALIGGLAYKALQNYQAGKPLIANPDQLQLGAAPQGSGFETAAVTNDAAVTYIRGMIAAAAADGRIDAKEQQKILGGLQQAGLGAQAEEFLANELNSPATVEDLVQGVSTAEEAVQLFTAARVAIDLDNQEEHDFLVALAQGLKLDGDLVAHIDAAARAAA